MSIAIWIYICDYANIDASETVCINLMTIHFDMFVTVLDDVLWTVLDTKPTKVVDGPYSPEMNKIKHLVSHAVVAQQYKKVHYLYCCLHRNKYYSLRKDIDLFSIAIRQGIHQLQTMKNKKARIDPIHDYAYMIGFPNCTDVPPASLDKAIFHSIQIANMDLLAFAADKDIRAVVNKTIDGWTPFMFACINDAPTMIVKLIQCGADVNTSNTTTTALSLVVRNRNKGILKQFLGRCFPRYLSAALKHKNSPFTKLSKSIVQHIVSFESPIVKISDKIYNSSYVKQNSNIELLLSNYRNSTAKFI